MKTTINMFRNGAKIKLYNRRITIIAEDDYYFIEFVRFDKELPGLNKDKIITTPLKFSHESMNAVIQAVQLITNNKSF
jgi:hypothetical protein